jgi:hypothetical protein
MNPQDHSIRFQVIVDFQQRPEGDGFVEKMVFDDEETRVYVCEGEPYTFGPRNNFVQ